MPEKGMEKNEWMNEWVVIAELSLFSKLEATTKHRFTDCYRHTGSYTVWVFFVRLYSCKRCAQLDTNVKKMYYENK